MTTKQISVFLENKPGTLADFCRVLQANDIDMRAMCMADAQDFGILRIIVDDVLNTMTVLKDAGYVCQITKVLTIELEDKPGSLVKILDLLGEAGVNLEYSYAFLSKRKDKAYIILKASDNDKAVAILQKGGISTICQDDLKELFTD
ncbi:MAG: acetolactate synthase [Lachnospiraceae bacterium]|jgi:hypothetical protein|nr:acetolactate synthase [Lachnospiraceae bacterium]